MECKRDYTHTNTVNNTGKTFENTLITYLLVADINEDHYLYPDNKEGVRE